MLVHGIPINVIRYKHVNCDTINTKKCAYMQYIYIHTYNVQLDIYSECIRGAKRDTYINVSCGNYQYTDEIPDSLPTYTFMQKGICISYINVSCGTGYCMIVSIQYLVEVEFSTQRIVTHEMYSSMDTQL